MERIRQNKSVKGYEVSLSPIFSFTTHTHVHNRYVIVDGEGNILRQSSTLSRDKAIEYGKLVTNFYECGVHVVRDLNPSDSLEFLRLRGTSKEILVAPGVTKAGSKFSVIVIQGWKHAES